MNHDYHSPKFSRGMWKLCLYSRNARCHVSPVIAFILLLAVTIGCSGGKSIFPSDENVSNFENSVPIIALEEYADGFSATGILGAYELTIDKDTASSELVPMRTPSLGQSYILNAASFFVITPCARCLKLKGLAYDYPYIRADFLISHPFKKGDPSKPPSSTNRLDLDIFDPILIVVPDEEPTEPHLIDIKIYTDACGFPDGFTCELAEVIDNEFACPYFLVMDDSDTKINTWNRFEMGTENHVFSAWFTEGRFRLYLTFGYGISTRNYLERLTPTYYNPEFNRKAPWKVNVIPPSNGWSPDNPTETRDVIIEVYDWQIGATVDPNLDDLSDIFAASDILGVGVEIEGMTNTLNIQTVPTGTHTGRPDDPLIFTVPIANENLLPGGYYMGYVKVLDRRQPPQSPSYGQTDSMIHVPDGVTLNFVSMPEFATYQLFTAEVWTNDPPFADLDVSDYFIETGHSIVLCPGPATDDPDGSIIRYEYDFDYHGTEWFDVDASNTDGSPVTSPIFYNERFGEITRKVAMRVIDDGYPQKSDVGVETITIYPESYNRWVRTWGEGVGSAVAVDNLGNVYVAGTFEGTVDFDTGIGEDWHSSNGWNDNFLCKHDSNGNFMWARTWGGFDWSDSAADSVICDSQGNIYLTGIFIGIVDFDPGPGEDIHESEGIPEYGEHDIYLVKYSPDGTFLWAGTWTGSPRQWDVNYPYRLICDLNDNITVIGIFKGTVDFDPSDETRIVTAPGNTWPLFFSKFNSQCEHIQVLILYPGVTCHSACTDESDNIYLSGELYGKVDFDYRGGHYFWRTAATLCGDAYVAKFNPSLIPIWVANFGVDIIYDYWDTGISVSTNNSAVYLLSRLGGNSTNLDPVDLDPGPGIDLKPSIVGKNFAISKFDTNGVYQWGHRIGPYCTPIGCVTDSQTDVYVTGFFRDDYEREVDFDPSSKTDIHKSPDNNGNTFIVGFDSDGGYLGTRIFSGHLNRPHDIKISNEDLIFITGDFTPPVDFDPMSDETEYPPGTGDCAFLTRLF